MKTKNLSSRIYHLGSKRGMTLLEILIVVTLIIVLVVLLVLVFNPKRQIDKAKDGKRKSELATLSKVLEDWYNDKGCYPQPSEICYDDSGSQTCHVCGSEPTSPSIQPYLPELICDPEQPKKKYTYQVDDLGCPKKYWVYASLTNTSDPVIGSLGCQNGCGPSGDINYNYGVSSPGEEPQVGTGGPTTPPSTPTPTSVVAGGCSSFNPVFIMANPGVCNVCGTYQECRQAYPNLTYYKDSQCTQTCIKD